MYAIKYSRLAFFALILALLVMALGAYTRLTQAGLGCPDWPTCYGKMIPLADQKAWTEMIHRYCAGFLALLLLWLGAWALVQRAINHIRNHKILFPILFPCMLSLFVLFQAILGKWTVTLNLLPIIVAAHLMGGMIIAATLWWIVLAYGRQPFLFTNYRELRPWVLVGCGFLGVQIALGAWTSANNASLVCATFPFCNGYIVPPMDWRSAFLGSQDPGLSMTALTAIQMAHRVGALIITVYMFSFVSVLLISYKYRKIKSLGAILLVLLSIQLALGILNVLLKLPLGIAVAHNLVAALMLLTLVTLLFRTRRI